MLSALAQRTTQSRELNNMCLDNAMLEKQRECDDALFLAEAFKNASLSEQQSKNKQKKKKGSSLHEGNIGTDKTGKNEAQVDSRANVTTKKRVERTKNNIKANVNAPLAMSTPAATAAAQATASNGSKNSRQRRNEKREFLKREEQGAREDENFFGKKSVEEEEEEQAVNVATPNAQQEKKKSQKEKEDSGKIASKSAGLNLANKFTAVASANEGIIAKTLEARPPPGYTSQGAYFTQGEKLKKASDEKGAYVSPFAHILQSAPTSLPPSFDTPQGARGEGFVLGMDDPNAPKSLFNTDSTWQGSAAFSPPSKFRDVKSIPSFVPRTPAGNNGGNDSNGRSSRLNHQHQAESDVDFIPREEKDDHLTANDLYKTELCRSFTETGECRYNDKCQFAHGRDQLRCVVRHPKYKTQVCRTFTETGQCPYGNRCRFVHEKLPEKGVLGTLATNSHHIVLENWNPSAGNEPLCLQRQQQASREEYGGQVNFGSRLGIFRHITHDEDQQHQSPSNAYKYTDRSYSHTSPTTSSPESSNEEEYRYQESPRDASYY